jgi:hypothetical protein
VSRKPGRVPEPNPRCCHCFLWRSFREEQCVAAASGAELAEQLAKLRRVDLQKVGVDIQIDQLHPEARWAEDLARPGCELTEVPGAQRGKDDADCPGLPTRKCRRQMRRREIEPVGGLDDSFSGGCADARNAPQRTRNCSFIHTRFPRDVSNRRTTSSGLGPRRNHPGTGFGEHDTNYTAGRHLKQPLIVASDQGNRSTC